MVHIVHCSARLGVYGLRLPTGGATIPEGLLTVDGSPARMAPRFREKIPSHPPRPERSIT